MTRPAPPSDPRPDPAPPAAWRRFLGLTLGTAAAAGAAAFVFIAAMDPYGLRAAPGRRPGPVMDLNQRFMYPQIVRGGAFDAAVFGTSTARLLDPQALGRAFPGRFANLAMNAATPWEQMQLARFFLGRVRARAVILGLDASWCDPAADEKRLTFRPFPPWLYGEDAPWRGLLAQWNLQSLEIAGRVLLHRLGRMRERIRGDGYEVFTPPEATYDAARAAAHIRAMAAAQLPTAPQPAGPGRTFPALVWLDGFLAAAPSDALKVAAFMPAHVAVQPRPGSPEAAQEAACKEEVAAIGRRHGATVVDFRIPSPVTARDANYWDALHYRLPIAERVLDGLRRAVATGADDPEGVYRVLARPPQG
ncbi:conserved hypothetical protein [Methylobacterium sp. 4-46]|uniref:hypothetical protein n=1 Tax=unclassified Methylobacterium TaxID=2615210 RepID=UPI000165CE03|nr:MULTISPECIES: hypothetical protein [Methylobacterium]ACA19832.1 conserved hypothetical protein [Methylobacterium sp. 4-46]WFT79016.1 hypothetical protein QA634_27790 [Methylobacterium nodulans]